MKAEEAPLAWYWFALMGATLSVGLVAFIFGQRGGSNSASIVLSVVYVAGVALAWLAGFAFGPPSMPRRGGPLVGTVVLAISTLAFETAVLVAAAEAQWDVRVQAVIVAVLPALCAFLSGRVLAGDLARSVRGA
ncbi:MAG: hypothetical protein AAF081_04450 [Actinomycetota bacterium]